MPDPVRHRVEDAILAFLVEPPANAYHYGYLRALLWVHMTMMGGVTTKETEAANKMLDAVVSPASNPHLSISKGMRSTGATPH